MLETMRMVWTATLLLMGCTGPRENVPQSPALSSHADTEIQRTVHLEHVSARHVADLILESIAESGVVTAGNVGFCALMTPEFWAEKEIERQSRPQPIPVPRSGDTWITADPMTNSVVITAKPEDVDDADRLAEFVRWLDADVFDSYGLRRL
jgi:hypothetical protein